MNTIAPLVFRIQSCTNVMKDIMKWIADDSDDRKKVLWVCGLAGTGKSILTTITQIMRGLHVSGLLVCKPAVS
jgi:adenylylsulfate kinase-like enzyme